MKKVFLFAAAALFALASCQGVDPDDNGGLIDDNGGDNGGGTETELHASLSGSNYYLIQMDGTTAESIASKVVADYRPDGAGKNLWVWEGTYAGGTPSGLNFYGLTEGWVCLEVVAGPGWSGAGWQVNNKEGQAADWLKMKDLANGTSNYYLHVAYKGAANEAHILGFGYAAGGEYKFAVGQGSMEDAGVTYNAIAPINNDGTFDPKEWNEYEVKLSDMGIDFSQDITDANVFWCLSGGVGGKQINLDAVFVYKK